MLYEIREKNGRFNLFLRKKNGMKFKKSFSDRQHAERFVKDYLRLCCVVCKQKGLVYKTRGTGGMYGGGNRRNTARGRAPAGSVVVCPECRAKHLVEYESREVQSWFYDKEGRHSYTATVKDLVLSPTADERQASTQQANDPDPRQRGS
ncbi:hypothetical protein TFLX_06607 [Thermoflexales bacterium]|nr:hypothetical protein TFLX_06607 [Thermoflexales bacterium]